MILNFCSVAYLAVIGCSALSCFFLWAALNRAPERTKTAFLFCLALVNVLQHFFKQFLYPHLRGAEFGLINTASNVCAALILLTPFALISKKGFFRIFVSYVGSIAAGGSLAFPLWFMGESILQWEFLRFAVCHLLLLFTSLLPVLWGMRRPSYRDFWKTAPLFLLVLTVLLLNNAAVVFLNPKIAPEMRYAELYQINPFGIMHPTGTFPLFDRLCTALSPKCFLPQENNAFYTPVLWYAIPVALLVTLVSLLLFCLIDRKRLQRDFKKFLTKLS